MVGEISKIAGRLITLRLVVPDDAEYIHHLRTDEKYNRHLSPVTGTPEDQRAWINNYKHREADGQEYYYIIQRTTDAEPCGLVRLYNISETEFTWGSWILADNKPRKAALESAVISFGIGFEELGLQRGVFDVRLDNAHAIAFYRRFGPVEMYSDEQNLYFEYHREAYFRNREQHNQVLEKLIV